MVSTIPQYQVYWKIFIGNENDQRQDIFYKGLHSGSRYDAMLTTQGDDGWLLAIVPTHIVPDEIALNIVFWYGIVLDE